MVYAYGGVGIGKTLLKTVHGGIFGGIKGSIAAFGFPQIVEIDVLCDSTQPCFDIAIPVILVEMRESPQHGVLHDILGKLFIAA